MLATGFLVSLILWSFLVFGSLKVSLFLFKEKILSERWLLVAPYVVASLLFFAIRYRFSLWVITRQEAHELFSIGSFWKLDVIVLVLCLPLFYAISILKPEWVVRTLVNLPLVVLLPFALKLALYFSGVVDWDAHPAMLMPTRIE